MTTFVTIKTTGDSDYFDFATFIASHVHLTDVTHSSTFLKVPADQNRSATFFGTDFHFSNGFPDGGTVKSIVQKEGAHVYATITGLDIPIAQAANAFLTGDVQALINLLGDMRVTGNIGDDTLVSGNGDDTFVGGKGADFMGGTNGTDTVDYSAASSRVVANLATGGTIGDAKGDTYGSIEVLKGSKFADQLTGNTKINTLIGNDGNDVLKGGAGRDTLVGGAGADKITGGGAHDVLTGGLGGDQFIYNKLNEGGDEVTTFDSKDTIQIKMSAIGVEAGDILNFVASTSPAANNNAPVFLYDTDDKTLVFDSNGSDAGGRHAILTISGGGAIHGFDDIILF
ncbi:hypothetical protein BH10PSE7_BH10PSE7_02320 [soil metagenome]